MRTVAGDDVTIIGDAVTTSKRRHQDFCDDEVVKPIAFTKTALDDVELKDTIMVDALKLVGEGFSRCTVHVEYKWKPPTCSTCKVFGHVLDDCTKRIVSNVLKNPIQAARGVQVGSKVGFKQIKQVYQPISKKNGDNTSGEKKQVGVASQKASNLNPFDALDSVENDDDLGINKGNSKLYEAFDSPTTTPLIEMINNLKRQILDDKLVLVDDDGKPLKKVNSPVNSDNDSEVEEVFIETTGFIESTSLNSGSRIRFGTKSLLEQWRETKMDDDYDPYHDDMYIGYDMSENLQAVCGDLNIKVRGRKKK
ncbi:hypothetical protein Tco_0686201 [Tanacetum coccineum]